MPLGHFGGSAPPALRVAAGGSAPAGDLMQEALARTGPTRQGTPAVPEQLQMFYHAVRVRNSAAISLPNNTSATVTFDTEDWDTGELHSTAANTGRLTAVVDGRYLIFACIGFAANATGDRSVDLLLNAITGTASMQIAAVTSANAIRLNVVTQRNLVAGDYVTVVAYQNSGGALDLPVLDTSTPVFGMIRLS